jgi:hypothetical protein
MGSRKEQDRFKTTKGSQSTLPSGTSIVRVVLAHSGTVELEFGLLDRDRARDRRSYRSLTCSHYSSIH